MKPPGWLPVAGLVIAALFVVGVEQHEPAARQATPHPVSPVTQGAIENTLERYNRFVQDFYASAGSPRPLDAFPASTSLKHQLFRDLGYLRDNGLVLVLDLADMETGPAQAEEGGLIRVDVREEWNHVLQRADSREPVDAIRGQTLRTRYRLRRGQGGWQVVAWQPLPLSDVPEEPMP